uniref:Aromatic-L-amino-acid decarboxylase n=1 Tax=Timema monikensis TaxID=170555 RepID=A0A7R9HS24_9NEOP|nr:unnamed protein product [Timema monikensis]
METPQFKDFAKDMVDYIGGYLDNIRDRRVLPTVQPGYLRPLLPESAPDTPDKWQDVMSDIERVIMPGYHILNSPRPIPLFTSQVVYLPGYATNHREHVVMTDSVRPGGSIPHDRKYNVPALEGCRNHKTVLDPSQACSSHLERVVGRDNKRNKSTFDYSCKVFHKTGTSTLTITYLHCQNIILICCHEFCERRSYSVSPLETSSGGSWQELSTCSCPQVTHWHSPKFFAYFPTANSYPAIVADMLSGAIACIGFSWVGTHISSLYGLIGVVVNPLLLIASPACTELEVIMLDWLGKMLDLPKTFLACSGGKGGGVIQVSVLEARGWRHTGQVSWGQGGGVIQVNHAGITAIFNIFLCLQGTASEATLVALLGAKARALRRAKQEHPEWTDMDIVSRLVGYGSGTGRATALGTDRTTALVSIHWSLSVLGTGRATALGTDRTTALVSIHWSLSVLGTGRATALGTDRATALRTGRTTALNEASLDFTVGSLLFKDYQHYTDCERLGFNLNQNGYFPHLLYDVRDTILTTECAFRATAS